MAYNFHDATFNACFRHAEFLPCPVCQALEAPDNDASEEAKDWMERAYETHLLVQECFFVLPFDGIEYDFGNVNVQRELNEQFQTLTEGI